MDDTEQPLRRDYASAAEAMEILKIRAQTLYAYVSRGWIRSIPQKGLKDRLYLREDIDRVSKRSLARSGHGPVAASAMNWGEPIFPTSVTEITEHGPRYRGHLAAELVHAGASFESVAELLWTGVYSLRHPDWPVQKAGPEVIKLAQTLTGLQASENVLESFALVVLMLGMRRGSVADRLLQGNTLAAAREVIQTVVACCGFVGSGKGYQPMKKGQSIAEGLMQSFGMAVTEENRIALEAILILMADHELPPGTLCARVVASAGGTLHSSLASALCATSGLDIGRTYDRVEDLLGQSQRPDLIATRAHHLLKNGQAIPGFTHPLYLRGDPRAAQLLEIARSRKTQSRPLTAAFRFIEHMQAEAGIYPRQEMALVLLARGMGLPRQAPAALFVLGRLAGWVAHVQEQRSAGTLLRPRAKFVSAAAVGSSAFE